VTARPVEDRDPVALEDAPDLFDAPEADEDRAGYRLRSLSHLTWAVRRLAILRRRRLDVSTTAQAEIDRVQAWAAREDAKLARDAGWFEAIIAEYALDERARDERRKSIATPYGVVKTRVSAGAWDVDPDALLPWLAEHRPDLLRRKVTEAPDLAAMRRALAVEGGEVFDRDSGVPVPGVKVGEPTVTASVDVDLDLHADDEADR
jgi:hypothetical protein